MFCGAWSTIRATFVAAVTLGALLAGAALPAGTTHAEPAQGGGCGGPYTGITGQPVVLTATVSGLRGVVTYYWTFGDGETGDKNPTSHVYTRAGTYTITLRATSSTLDSASCETSITISGSAVSTPTPTTVGPIQQPASGAGTVALAAGWNLVAGPSGSRFPQASGALYTLQAGDVGYEVLATTDGVQGGLGYWAYFAGPVTAQFAGAGATTASIDAPAGQWVIVGNPSATITVRVSGADSVLRYDPTTGSYLAVNSLAPGQGAWAISSAGGTITIAP